MVVKILVGYFVLINLFAFLLNFLDKKKAIKQKQRISEKTLLITALVGGSLGAIFAMKIFRHKTVKKSYRLKFKLILFVQLIAICLIIDNYYPFLNNVLIKVKSWIKLI